MKPLILVLSVALFVTLFNLGSAGTDADTHVVASYQGYEKRQFPPVTILLCARPFGNGLKNAARAEKAIQDYLSTMPMTIGTSTFFENENKNLTYWSDHFCKYAKDFYDHKIDTNGYHKQDIYFMECIHLAFYAKKVTFPNHTVSAGSISDEDQMKILAAGWEMIQKMEAVKDPKQAIRHISMLVEITENNEVYVGPTDHHAHY